MNKNQLKKLNPQQRAAVRYGQGPLLVIAGAGTGKTTVITERIKYLIVSKKLKPAEILALTFTDKAAGEMEERVDLAMPYGYTDMWISTFHSFCDRVLRQEALQIGLNANYQLMGGAETTQFLINHLFKFKLGHYRPLGNPTQFVEGLLQHFSRLKDEDIQPSEYVHWVKANSLQLGTDNQKKYLELATAYQTYEELKTQKDVMDFGDLITRVLQLFRTRPNILRQYQQKFKYLLIDEFQDTNIAQNELVRLLAGKQANLTVVADDDQAIYRWRGAATANVIQFRRNFPKAKLITLTQNYRSTQEILDRAYQLIQHNNPDRLEVKEKINKKLVSARQVVGQPIKLILTGRLEDEAEAVAKKISGLTKKKYQYQDIALLVRANNHAEAFTRALSRAGIPYQFLGPGQLFRQPEVKDLIAYLKLLDNFEDGPAVYRVLSMGVFGLSGRDLAAISNFARRQNMAFFEACEQADQVFLNQEAREKIKKFVQMVHRHLDLLVKETAGQILYYFLQDSGLLEQLTDYKTVAQEKQAQNIAKLFDRLKSYEAAHEDASVQATVAWISLAMERGESPLAGTTDWVAENKVNLLTIHSAKGLEFPVVFLVNLVSGRFPTRERQEQIPIPDELIKEILPEGDYHLQEERRLFYVGLTRARNRLWLTAADYYGEGRRKIKLSPFVAETLGEKIISQKQIQGQSQQLTFFDYQKPQEEKQSLVVSDQPAVNFLSFSQIDVFATCPLQYRYRYWQRIPTLPSATLTFGTTMHNTLRDFYQQAKQGSQPTEQDLLVLFAKNWSTAGLTNADHERKTRNRGAKMLKKFYQQEYDPQNLPLALEQGFAIRVAADLKVGGRLDRVDRQGGKLEIIDYKTGRAWEQKRVDRSLQMTIYALAVTDQGIYNQPPEDVILSFYFLQTGEKKSTQRTAAQLEKDKQAIIEIAEQINHSDFKPNPGIWCRFCDFKLICEAWR
ncbi:hypothetical protein COT66_01030 [Candidatus Shapirobacteria bacterium CG09_land_8_20_14_0_10_49_15]|uniref:DNA 3'-5' helicase n=1 Tax=Candidatus Shapirobacteria bacterium CG09_land_8_20_14_0_10_49_15 TaxID=1974482 RepID=A0A2M6XB32_9BACT|nr:MAG: hypothetical protein COT66_01030 [Candidatus Shapirobacteria bacterium CG09_land_8_20_14_0_10_49_15]